jgi:hypothetical protein
MVEKWTWGRLPTDLELRSVLRKRLDLMLVEAIYLFIFF